MDIVSFFALFILCLPLPDIMRKTYCSYIIKGMGMFAIFMVFCAYNAFATFFKLNRNITVYHTEGAQGKRVEPRLFFKRVAKNQRDLILCVIGIVFSFLTLFLSAQLKHMSKDPEPVIEEKSAEDKKNDLPVCSNNQAYYTRDKR